MAGLIDWIEKRKLDKKTTCFFGTRADKLLNFMLVRSSAFTRKTRLKAELQTMNYEQFTKLKNSVFDFGP